MSVEEKMNAVLKIQDEISGKKGEQRKVIQVLNENKKDLAATDRGGHAFNKDVLQKEKEALQAEIALGNSDDRALAALDDKIAKADEHGKNVAILCGTVTGLESKFEQVGAEIQELGWRQKQALKDLLQEEGELLGAEYLECAQKLEELFLRLAGLHQLQWPSNAPSRPDQNRFSIPVFSYLQCHKVADDRGLTAGSRKIKAWGQDCSGTVGENEKTRLVASGVEFI